MSLKEKKWNFTQRFTHAHHIAHVTMQFTWSSMLVLLQFGYITTGAQHHEQLRQ